MGGLGGGGGVLLPSFEKKLWAARVFKPWSSLREIKLKFDTLFKAQEWHRI